jgi:hypothetical protein
MANIYDYKPGDKVITPTNMVAVVVKETYQGEKLILEYEETPEWQKDDVVNIVTGNGYRHIKSVTLSKEWVKPLDESKYSSCKVVIR